MISHELEHHEGRRVPPRLSARAPPAFLRQQCDCVRSRDLESGALDLDHMGESPLAQLLLAALVAA